MALPTPADFRLMFSGTFTGVDDNYLQMWLDAAALQVSASVFGPKRNIAILFKTAAMLTSTPAGQGVKMARPDGNSTYAAEFNRIKLQVTPGWYRVA